MSRESSTDVVDRWSDDDATVAGGDRLSSKLFRWFVVVALIPAGVLLAGGTWAVMAGLRRVGTLGPWGRVTETGRSLMEAVDTAGPVAPALAEALARHERELATSALQADRWVYIGERVLDLMPVLALATAFVLALVAWWVSRRLARTLARPILDLVGWAERIGRDEPVEESPGGAGVREVRILRNALLSASRRLQAARARALQAERLKAWADMARRTAHEMKNALTPLRLAAFRLNRELSDRPETEEALQVVGEEVRRLEELARAFSALGRPPEEPPTRVDVAELMASLVNTDVPPHVEVRTDFEAAGFVEAHHEQLLRAFRNILRNALEAVEESGERVIDMSVGPAETSAGAVEVVIADRGPGLPPVPPDRLFDPDFSGRSDGTGLGLALARRAVQNAGGTISAGNRGGGGAQFVVRLPGARVPEGNDRSDAAPSLSSRTAEPT